jgi:hypothetical protein
MADQNQNTDPNAGGTGDNQQQQQQQQAPAGNSGDDLNAKIQAGIDAALQPIKAKLDNAYAARDEALAKVAEFERKEREREIARLKKKVSIKKLMSGRLLKSVPSVLLRRSVSLNCPVTLKFGTV